jgi:hypothetical protein
LTIVVLNAEEPGDDDQAGPSRMPGNVLKHKWSPQSLLLKIGDFPSIRTIRRRSSPLIIFRF